MKILNRWTNACLWEGEAASLGEAVKEAIASGADLSEANLYRANLYGVNLYRANLSGANGEKQKIARMRVFSGLYRYTVQAVVFEDGAPWVRMGCLWKSVKEWDKIGIRNSNPSEFPDNGSEKSEGRVRAFKFARDAAMRDAKAVKAEIKAKAVAK